MVLELLMIDGRQAFTQSDGCCDCLPPCRVWNAEHRHLGDRRMPQQDGFDLRRIDILASADNHVA